MPGRQNGPRRRTPSQGARRAGGSGPSAGRGPRGVNLWPRRIITGTGLLVVVALLVWGAVSAVRALLTGSPPDPQPQSAAQSGTDASGYPLGADQRATADGIVTGDTTVDVPVCLEPNLVVRATASGATSGQAVPIDVSLRNRGSVACRVGLSSLAVTITTGNLTVYDSAACDQGAESEQVLLLSPDRTWSGTLGWDGLVHANGCAAPPGGERAADPGTYQLRVLLDGKDTGNHVVFDVGAAPSPKPSPPPQPQSGGQSGAQSR